MTGISLSPNPPIERSFDVYSKQTEDAYYAAETVGQPERAATQIDKQLAEMPELLDHLSDAISELEKRLVGVLRQVDDSDKVGGEPRQLLVPVAEQLERNNDGISAARRRIVSILDRLEL